jgi:hypothetical protein
VIVSCDTKWPPIILHPSPKSRILDTNPMARIGHALENTPRIEGFPFRRLLFEVIIIR